MLVLAVGSILLIVGVLSIRFPELIESLKKNDSRKWEELGSPPGYAFSKAVGVYSWVLNHGYESSGSSDVQRLGAKSLHRALFARHSLLIGGALVVVGFIATLFGI